MRYKFHIKHLSSWSPLVQKILEHIANHTRDWEVFPAKAIEGIVQKYVDRVPKGIYDYELKRNGSEYMLFEDDECVLRIDLIEIHELQNI